MGELGAKLRATNEGSISFYCPGCESAHTIRLGSWLFDGNETAPTFSPSVRTFIRERVDRAGIRRPEKTLCHLFVRSGRIEYLSDCDHSLAGTSVDLPDWPADYAWGGDHD